MSDRLSHVLSLLLSFFVSRSPHRGWQQHVIAATLASAAIATCVFAFSPFARTENIEPQLHGHTKMSVEQAINYALCGRYGYLFLKPGTPAPVFWASPNTPILDFITTKYG